jgi:hypothetical protein
MSQNYFFRIHSSPIIQNINNSTLSGAFAMPAADVNMNRENSFAMNRHIHMNANYSTPLLEKKWVGVSTRDSSTLTSRRRALEIGNGTTNEKGTQQVSFVSNHETNSRIEALARVRGGGSVVPPKSRNSPHHTNAPMVVASTIKYAKKNVFPLTVSREYNNLTFCQQNNCLPNYTNVMEKKLHA